MAGIVFVTTEKLQEMVEFYTDTLGMTPWLSQPDVEMLAHGNMIIGFHQQQKPTPAGCLFTFFYSSQEEVDAMYAKIKDLATTTPKFNEKYQIYNFFARDPEGRKLEFQQFRHDLKPLNCEV
ncbi:MAG: VOC family protein [Candidatus Kariarchaeaceae archaeon]|jgi:catechol 2,3-dioxygenase-like lactoylglutathione lyase family enzyme